MRIFILIFFFLFLNFANASIKSNIVDNFKLIQNIKFNFEQKIGKKGSIKSQQTEYEAIKTHADITKAKNLLGYDPKVCFDEGIEAFLDWHKHYEYL